MTGYDIYNKAILRLGYDNNLTDDLSARSLEFIGQIAEELLITPPHSLLEEIKADGKRLEALCCGTAMLLALSLGDRVRHIAFCELFNAKRAAILGHSEKVEDLLPVSEGGDM